jgi:hypothetical protein
MLKRYAVNQEFTCNVKSEPRAEDIFLVWKNSHGAYYTLRGDSQPNGIYKMLVKDGVNIH